MTSVVGSDPEGQEMMQGDWVRLAAPFQLPACPDVPVSNVVIISQTCDIVQKTRRCILIAPIAQASEDDYREAARGKRPLLLAFPAQDDAPVVLLEHATSVPKTLLADAILVRRMSCEPASHAARDFARRVGSAYSRFPIPDEAVPALSKFTDRIRKEAPKDRSVGRVLKRVREIRVESRTVWRAWSDRMMSSRAARSRRSLRMISHTRSTG